MRVWGRENSPEKMGRRVLGRVHLFILLHNCCYHHYFWRVFDLVRVTHNPGTAGKYGGGRCKGIYIRCLKSVVDARVYTFRYISWAHQPGPHRQEEGQTPAGLFSVTLRLVTSAVLDFVFIARIESFGRPFPSLTLPGRMLSTHDKPISIARCGNKVRCLHSDSNLTHGNDRPYFDVFK